VLARRFGEKAVEIASEAALIGEILVNEVFELGVSSPLNHVFSIVSERG